MYMLKEMVGTGRILVFCVTSAFASAAFPQSQSQLLRGVETTEPILIAQSERGCCVLKTSHVKCAYTIKKYCEAQAKSAGVTFEFHDGTSCREIKSCPSR